MSGKKLSGKITVLFAIFTLAIIITMTTVAAAQQENILLNFSNGGSSGSDPYSDLIFDKAGNLYGTTVFGGTGTGVNCNYDGCGTVFELVRQANGGWVERVLHNFQGHGGDGAQPFAGLTFDAAGNLYGTTTVGGRSTNCSLQGCGTVFELSPTASGQWEEKVIYSFKARDDGASPSGGVVLDAEGNLYGTTSDGNLAGCGNCGLVYELSPSASGVWTEKVLYNFPPTGPTQPTGKLVLDAAGNIYGIAYSDAVFELSPKADGYYLTVLHNFADNGVDGYLPHGGLISDAEGNLYGTTIQGGIGQCANEHHAYFGCGTVFEMVKPTAPGGAWTENILYTFPGSNLSDPAPKGGVIFDAEGNLYGTTYGGGVYGLAYGGLGTVFRLTPAWDGSWTEKTLHSFGNGTDGFWPMGGLVADSAGNLYGTTSWGGISGGGSGIVFEITP